MDARDLRAAKWLTTSRCWTGKVRDCSLSVRPDYGINRFHVVPPQDVDLCLAQESAEITAAREAMQRSHLEEIDQAVLLVSMLRDLAGLQQVALELNLNPASTSVDDMDPIPFTPALAQEVLRAAVCADSRPATIISR